MRPFTYERATTPAEAAAAVARTPGAKFIAGGTNLLDLMKLQIETPTHLVDVNGLKLDQIETTPEGGLRIGALVRMRTTERSPLVLGRWQAVAQGAKLVGSIQIRNLATLGGNVCNAAPSADVTPALVAFGGDAVTAGPNGGRTVPLEAFFLGPRRTVLEPGELLVDVRLPAPPPRTGSFYLRHTPRMEMDIAVAGSAAVVTLDGDRIAEARICLASVAPTPVRAPSAEVLLRGAPPDDETIRRAAAAAAADCRPISDMRGSDDYRRHLVTVLTERALRGAIEQAQR